jgi:DNA-3-methyladenine glycosylase
VYRSYGIHWCANLVTGPAGAGGAVLLRGVEIERGDDVVAGRRVGATRVHWANGPGKLCQALAIDRSLDGQPMEKSNVIVSPGSFPLELSITPRVGISKAVEWLLRFKAGS